MKPEPFAVKVLVLNSGGFDSVLMTDIISRTKPEGVKFEFINLFFNYGQLNLEEERRCSKKSAERLGAEFMEVTLPKFKWSNSEFYKKDSNDLYGQELEMRNMVFLSYALSIALARGCNSVFMAIIQNEVSYYDCTEAFINKIRGIYNDRGIDLYTPLINNSKMDLIYPFYQSGLTGDDFITCDVPVDGKPCGKCSSCKDINLILELVEKMRK